MTSPGPANLIIDVDGIAAGHAHDRTVGTGVTVLLPDARAVAAVDTRGGGPGTRETDALVPENLVDDVDAVVLSGGSSYGLAAASAVAKKLGAKGRGFRMGGSEMVSPVVPSAILFDLTNGGDKSWGGEPPYDLLGAAALEACSHESFPLGNVGAGFGAAAGLLKGGLGSASFVTADGLQVGALAVVNSFGSAVIPGTDCFWAWPFELYGEFGGRKPGNASIDQDVLGYTKAHGSSRKQNTTLGVIATNAALTPAQARRVAIMAQDGLARAIRPAHTLMDGDTIFVLATGARPLDESAAFEVSHIGALAADCMARAIARGVYEAQSLYALDGYKSRFGA